MKTAKKPSEVVTSITIHSSVRKELKVIAAKNGVSFGRECGNRLAESLKKPSGKKTA